MPLQLDSPIGTLVVTRFADGTIHVGYGGDVDFVLTQDEAAELSNYLTASATALQSARDAIATSVIEAADRETIAAAQAITEVIP
jgi:hypothetical protein